MSEEEAIVHNIKLMLKNNMNIFEETGSFMYFNKTTAENVKDLLDLYQKEKMNSSNLSEQLNKEKEKNKENIAMIDLMAKAIENLDDQLVINHYRNKEEVIERFKELLKERN